MMFRVVFCDILPCKMIVDRRFRGAYCLHHQGWVSLARKDRSNTNSKILLGYPHPLSHPGWLIMMGWDYVSEPRPPSDMWARSTIVIMMPAGDNSWLVHHSSLAVLKAETSGESRRNGRRSENFAYQYLKYLKGSFTCRKILRHGMGPSRLLPIREEGVLRIFIALKNPTHWPGSNPRPLGPVASTPTTTPPRRRTLVTTNKIVARKCLSFLHIALLLLPSCAGLVWKDRIN
jgi:hypothetical protein